MRTAIIAAMVAITILGIQETRVRSMQAALNQSEWLRGYILSRCDRPNGTHPEINDDGRNLP